MASKFYLASKNSVLVEITVTRSKSGKFNLHDVAMTISQRGGRPSFCVACQRDTESSLIDSISVPYNRRRRCSALVAYIFNVDCAAHTTVQSHNVLPSHISIDHICRTS